MGCGASTPEVEKKQYVFRVRLLGGLNLYNNGFGVQAPGTYTRAGRFEGSSDPFCVLQCSGTKQRFESDVRLHTVNPVWNQEFYFHTSTKNPVLTLSVKDKDVVGNDDLLGQAEVNLTGVIGKEKERECWVPLTGSRGGGEIGFSVIECYRKHIKAVQGKDVKPMDSFSGSSDCYMTLQIGQQEKQQTSVKGWTLNPIWNETFTFYVPYTIKAQVAMILYDRDSVGVDMNMGWHYEYFSGMPETKSKEPKKLEVDITNAQGKLEFEIVDDVELQEVEEAKTLTEEDKKKLPSDRPMGCNFEVRVLGAYNLAVADYNPVGDFINAAACEVWHEFKDYEGGSDPFARVTVEGVTYDTQHINNTLEPVWNEKFRFVCRDRESSMINVEVWDHDLIANDCIGKVAIPLNTLKPGKRQEVWSFLDKGRGELGLELIQSHMLHVRVVSGNGFAAKDMNGMCDPYVKLTLAGIDYQTRVVRNDRNPWFEEDFRFGVQTLDNLKMKFEVWDSDLMIFKKGLSEDLIGTCELDVSNLIPGMTNEFEIALTRGGGKEEGFLKIQVTEEVPIPDSVLDLLKKQGQEAFDNACKKMNEVKESVACLKMPNFDDKEEAEFEVADPKLAPRPRFSRMAVEVVATRNLKCTEPFYLGVSVPQQGKRYKTKEYRDPSKADIGETFQFGIPSKITGALEVTVFESNAHAYTGGWSTSHHSRMIYKFTEANGGDGVIRGSPADDEWLKGEKGNVIIRVREMFRFQVRVLGAKDIKVDKDPYVTVQPGAGTMFKTSVVSNDPKKDRTSGVPGQPKWDEQFTFFTVEKETVTFRLMDESLTGDTNLGTAKIDLSDVRRGVLKRFDLTLDKGGTLTVEVLEEEKMALMDRMIDGAKNAAKLAEALASEVKEAAGAAVAGAAAAVTGAFGSMF